MTAPQEYETGNREGAMHLAAVVGVLIATAWTSHALGFTGVFATVYIPSVLTCFALIQSHNMMERAKVARRRAAEARQ